MRHSQLWWSGIIVALGTAACQRPAFIGSPERAAVRPGITVLVEDSIHLLRNRRVGLITNQTGIDAQRTSSIDVLRSDRARNAGVSLVRLFAPEHGIRGTEDREGLSDEVDQRTGLPIVSLYGASTSAPPDSLVRDLDVLIVDLQDIGTRTWTYVGVMLYAMQTAARLDKPVIVVDRPNPISGRHFGGPLLDTALANPYPPTPQRAGRAYALHPVPLRHGLTMGELARYYGREVGIRARLHVIPMSGWTRSMWYDDTGLPWVRPSPNLPDLASALIYPSLVAFEATNVSVGRGTTDAFTRFGAPWLDAARVARLIHDQNVPGVLVAVDSFTPVNPGDSKYNGRRIPGVKIHITDRDAVDSGLLGASVLWAIARVHRDSLTIRDATFDDRFGSAAARVALLRGDEPRAVMARLRPSIDAYWARAASIRMYP